MKLSGFFILNVILLTISLNFSVIAQSADVKSSMDNTEISSEAKKSKIKKELFYKCVLGNELRWMRLNYLKNGHCQTTYSREGKAKDVSKAESYELCENVLKNIKLNLEKGGYVCEEKILMGNLNLD